MKPEIGKYFALHTYSHTDKRMLWKVLTRPCDLSSAEISAEVDRKHHCPKGQEVFIVRVVDADDSEYEIDRRVKNSWHTDYAAALLSVKEGRHPDILKVY